MKKTLNLKKLIVCILIPLAVGGIAALITGGSMADYEMINKPALSPPPIVFPIVWTILYVLMGISSYRICISDTESWKQNRALALYALQLILNFFWPILFFLLKVYFIAFVELVIMWISILAMIITFAKIDKPAAWLQVPYLLWVAFAGYLNLGVSILN